MNQLTETINSNPPSGSQISIMSGCTGIVHVQCDSTSYRICLVGNLANDEETKEAGKKFGFQIVTSKDGLRFAGERETATYFIVSDFESEEFEQLQRLEVRIIGKPAFLEMSLEGVLSYRNRPQYCLTMKDCVVVFTGFRKGTEISKLRKLVYYMGGSIKNEINGRVSHLVANSSTGEKYRYAASFAIPAMSEDWINFAWAHRDEIKARASDPSFLLYKLKLFHNLKIVIVGFSEEYRTIMEGLIKENGGISTTLEDNSASHIVVNDQTVLEKPSNCPEKALVVKAKWFWASIQINSCVCERQYLYDSNVARFSSPYSCNFSPLTPETRRRRRKRVRETAQQQVENDSPLDLTITFSPASKRRSFVEDLTFNYNDGSFAKASLQSFGTPWYDKTPLSPHFDWKVHSPRQHIETVTVAIEVCNNPELKKEILCAPGSNYDINKKSYKYDCKEQWDEIVEKKATVILEKLGKTKQLQEKVKGVVLLVGMRMLTWAEYHEGTLGFSREYSVNFLNDSLFTHQGIIDNKKAAEELMKDQSLNIKQKYKLACLYCFEKDILALYGQMTKEDFARFCDARYPESIMQPELVKFWSHYLNGEINNLKGEKSINQYRLEKAIQSGSRVAVEYCFERSNLKMNDAIIDAAVETIRNRIIMGPNALKTAFERNENDWVVFGKQRYKNSENSWVPSDYYIDILYFLLSKMRDDQKIEFLRKDIEGANYLIKFFENQRHSRTLEYLLDWPYQDYFMKTAALMWEFLPERSYADLLLEICNKIEPKKENLRSGEEKSFDYRKLLKEFWNQSPEHCKRYVLSDKEITYPNGVDETLKEGKELLVKLFSLKNFTDDDRKVIELILADATNEERENIICSQEGKDICLGLLKEERWEILDEFMSNSFPSEGQANKFKREFTFSKEAQLICIDFVKNYKWDSAESFIKWSALLEEENKFKKEMICSEDGLNACVDLISFDKKVEVVDRFIRWCFPSEEEMKKFKKELVFSYNGIWKCLELVTDDQLELADEFINLGLSSEKEIRELRKNVGNRMGTYVCKMFISHYSVEEVYDKGECLIGTMIKFKGGKWERVEKFLTWCFSSEEEINEFKRKIFEKSGISIHTSLIAASKWEEAEIFFAWLGLSAKEIRTFKKETLLSELNMGEINELLHENSPELFISDALDKWEKIELYLRWCLIDKEAVREFKDRFDEAYVFKRYENKKDEDKDEEDKDEQEQDKDEEDKDEEDKDEQDKDEEDKDEQEKDEEDKDEEDKDEEDKDEEDKDEEDKDEQDKDEQDKDEQDKDEQDKDEQDEEDKNEDEKEIPNDEKGILKKFNLLIKELLKNLSQ